MIDSRNSFYFGASLVGAGTRALPLAVMVASLLVACAQTGPVLPSPSAPPAATSGVQPATPSTAEPPPPGVNLSGFPLSYRQGYADGCASVKGSERKDTTRFAADANYRTGWQDGLALCRKR
jgi:hypothetical protein